jgi:SRSO17 transposase
MKQRRKGPIVCDFACMRVTEARACLAGPRLWLVIRRNVDDPSVVTFYLCTAPEAIETLRLVPMSGMGWPIDLTVEGGKDQLVLAQYETGSWLGWHLHMTLIMVAHQFLVSVRVQWHEEAPQP